VVDDLKNRLVVLADSLMGESIAPASRDNTLCAHCNALDKRGFKPLSTTGGAGPGTRAKFRSFINEEGVWANSHAAMGLNVNDFISWVYHNRPSNMPFIRRVSGSEHLIKDQSGQVFSVVTRIFVKFAAGSSTLAQAEAMYRAALAAAV